MEKKLLVVVCDCNQLSNFAVNDIDVKIAANIIRVLIVIELVVTGTYHFLFTHTMKA